MAFDRNEAADMAFGHRPVLLDECVEGLAIHPDGIYLDGTLGRAGHSWEIVRRLNAGGRLIGLDRDETALEAARQRLAPYMDRVTLVHSNFSRVAEVLNELGIPAVDGMLFDLGVSSPQLDDAQRGFSYMHDAPLDMRMDRTAGLTARTVVNEWSYEELRRILYEYGEERYAPAIARRIVAAREEAPIETTGQLVELIKSAMPPQAPAGKAAPGQAELPGPAHRRQRRAGGAHRHAAGRGQPSGPRRTPGGYHLPLAGGPHRQKNHAGAGHRLHLSPQFPGLRLRQKAHGAPGEPQAHRLRPRRADL